MSSISDELAQDRHPGGLSPVGIAMAMLGTIVAALALSLVYGPLDFYSPIVYLNLVIAYYMGKAVGRCAGVMLRRFHIDTMGIATVVGILGGVISVWASWVTYLYVASRMNFAFARLAFNPLSLLEVMEYIANNPIWSLSSRSGRSSSSMPAIFYYALWVGELALIAGTAVKESWRFVRTNKRCGRCGNWVRSTGESALFALPEGADITPMLLAGDLSILPTLPRMTGDDAVPHWLEATCYACGVCEGENAHVTLNLNALVPDKNKKLQLQVTPIAVLVEVAPKLEREIFEPAGDGKVGNPAEHMDGGNMGEKDSDSKDGLGDGVNSIPENTI